eukprot:scaffold2947_cov108-Skeletonema_dohrnii-CCMP3373.AAC.2
MALTLNCRENFRKLKNDEYYFTKIDGWGEYEFIRDLTDEEWEELGHDIANNKHVKMVDFTAGSLTYMKALNCHNMSFLFRGLNSNRSISINELILSRNEICADGVRSMVNTSNLQKLKIDSNHIGSEGFNVLIRALRDSSIKTLDCSMCCIESIDIDADNLPRFLKELHITYNFINTNDCRGLAKIIRGRGGKPSLEYLSMFMNRVDDEGVAILVDAFRDNTLLRTLHIEGNDEISRKGYIMLLKLLNDITSITSTLQSNHTLNRVGLVGGPIICPSIEGHDIIDHHMAMAMDINQKYHTDPVAAGREKIIQIQLHSGRRAELMKLFGLKRSLYCEINPLYLPEVISIVGSRHGQGELYAALKSSIDKLISSMSREQCITKQLAYYAARTEEIRATLDCIQQQLTFSTERSNELNTELEGIKAARVNEVDGGDRPNSNKRLRLK